MPEVLIEKFKPTTRRKNGLFIVNLESLKPIIKFEVIVSQVVYLPPHAVGGNHRHPRTEAFVCFEEGVEFHWMDRLGNHHVNQMSTEDRNPQIFTVSPDTPHAIKNNGGHGVTVIEFADAKQRNVEMVLVI